MKLRFISGAFALAFLSLTACSNLKPTSVSFDDMCTLENHNKLVEVDGYLSIGPALMVKTVENKEITADLNFSQQQQGENYILATVKMGKGKNTMDEIKNNYTEESLKIRTNDGQTIGYQDPVTVTGILNVYDEGDSNPVTCFMEVRQINKAS